MAHIRTVIRNGIATAVTGLATTGSRVHKMRYHALAESDLDAGANLIVQMGDEEQFGEPEYPRPRAQWMRCAIDVIAVARNAGDVDATIDQIILEVRAAVYAAVAAIGVAKDIEYQGIVDYGEDEENLDIVKAPMRFVAKYVTRENAADTPL